MNAPPDYAIEAALKAAAQSPCAKSKRGVCIYRLKRSGRGDVQADGVVAVGFNGQPGNVCAAAEVGAAFAAGRIVTTRDAGAAQAVADQCRRTCGQRCIHAEIRAIRYAAMKIGTLGFGDLEAVHVKLGHDGKLVAGGGPSCWQCSREILDIGLGRFWLFEEGEGGDTPGRPPDSWRRYTAAEFHRVTLDACGLVAP